MATILAKQAKREAFAMKRVLSDKLNAQLRLRSTSKAALAKDLGTSRSAVDRVLDPKNTSITLRTLVRAANRLGYRINLTLEPHIDKVESVSVPQQLEPLAHRLGEALDELPPR